MWKHIFSASLGLSLCTSFLCLASCFLALPECEQQTSKNLWTGLGPVPAFVCAGTEAGPLEPLPSTPEGQDRADEENGGLPPRGPPASVSAQMRDRSCRTDDKLQPLVAQPWGVGSTKTPNQGLFSPLFLSSLSSSYHINISHLTAGKDSETSKGGKQDLPWKRKARPLNTWPLVTITLVRNIFTYTWAWDWWLVSNQPEENVQLRAQVTPNCYCSSLGLTITITWLWCFCFCFFLSLMACRILLPRPRFELEAQSLNHWTAREIPLQSHLEYSDVTFQP